ncbi:MAG: hypothetical protein ACFNZR_03070 [Candidatus Nanosynbacter sp.]
MKYTKKVLIYLVLVIMSNFKNFTEKVRCRVIPITRDRRVWLDEKVADDDLYCVFMNDRSYELGEEYDDFLYVTVDSFVELADVILRELYARGFSSSDYRLINENHVHLDYSFMSDGTPWIAWHNVDAIVKGDITDEKDYRRDKTKRGRWMGYSELVWAIGKNQAHKIFEQI